MPERRPWRERPLVQLILVRYLEFVREPEAVFWTFVFPVLLTAGLGVAFRSRPAEPVRIGVELGTAADSLAAVLGGDPRVRVQVLGDSAANQALRTGKVALVVGSDPTGALRYRFDDTRPEARTARLVIDDILQRTAGRVDPLPIEEVQVRERGSRYVDFVVPGLLGMNLMGSGIWGLGFSIVDQRRKKLLKRLVATPMSRAEFLLSFLLARLGWLVLEVVLLVGFASLVFDVPLRGSVLALGLVSLLSALAFGGLGLLIAARPKTIEGASGLMNLIMLPMWVFSGVFFSAANFPAVMQPFIQALPLTAVVDALRAVMLEGASLRTLAPELGIIGAWVVATFGVALRIFRWL